MEGCGRFSATHKKGQRTEAGFLSIQYIVAAGFSIIFLVLMVNIVVVQYARGVVRSAADEGVRVGARVSSDPITLCENRAHSVLQGGGQMTASATATCTIANNQIQATTNAKFAPWLPLMPTLTEHDVSVSGKDTQ